MSKRARVGLGVVLVGAGLAALYAFVPWVRFQVTGLVRGEPFFEGRPTTVWVDTLKAGPDQEREQAAFALSQVAATPASVAALAAALSDPNFIVRRNAATSLNDLKEAAAPAAGDLIAALTDKDERVRRQVARALGGIQGDPAVVVPALIETFGKESDAATRLYAISSLRGYGTAAHVAIPNLVELMKESGGGFANPGDEARRTLATFGAAALPALREALSHKHPRVRGGAAVLVAGAGPAGKESLPALRGLLKDKERVVRIMVAEALWMMERQPADTLPVFLEGLKEKDFNTLITSVKAIGEMGPQAAAAVPALTAMLKDQNSAVRRMAAASLGQIGAPAKGAVPALEAILQDVDRDVGVEAAAAIKKLKATP